MVEVSGRAAASVAAAYDWNGMTRMVDVGGAMFDLPECRARRGAVGLLGTR